MQARIPDSYVPPAGSDGLTADGNTVLFDEASGMLTDIYKPIRLSNGNFTSTRWVSRSAFGSIIGSGVRAAGVSTGAGLMRTWRFAQIAAGTATDFGHKLALSIPPTQMKPAPITTT